MDKVEFQVGSDTYIYGDFKTKIDGIGEEKLANIYKYITKQTKPEARIEPAEEENERNESKTKEEERNIEELYDLFDKLSIEAKKKVAVELTSKTLYSSKQ